MHNRSLSLKKKSRGLFHAPLSPKRPVLIAEDLFLNTAETFMYLTHIHQKCLSPREGLINSRFHSELCFWGSRQDEFGGQPLFREPLGGGAPLSDGLLPASRTHASYVPANSRRRATYKFANPQLIWSQ
jgi:hypothetical protein